MRICANYQMVEEEIDLPWFDSEGKRHVATTTMTVPTDPNDTRRYSTRMNPLPNTFVPPPPVESQRTTTNGEPYKEKVPGRYCDHYCCPHNSIRKEGIMFNQIPSIQKVVDTPFIYKSNDVSLQKVAARSVHQKECLIQMRIPVEDKKERIICNQHQMETITTNVEWYNVNNEVQYTEVAMDV